MDLKDGINFDKTFSEVDSILEQITKLDTHEQKIKCLNMLTEQLKYVQIEAQSMVDNYIDNFINENVEELIEIGFNERGAIQQGIRTYGWAIRNQDEMAKHDHVLGDDILED
jgi:hypothetical protein